MKTAREWSSHLFAITLFACTAAGSMEIEEGKCESTARINVFEEGLQNHTNEDQPQTDQKDLISDKYQITEPSTMAPVSTTGTTSTTIEEYPAGNQEFTDFLRNLRLLLKPEKIELRQVYLQRAISNLANYIAWGEKHLQKHAIASLEENKSTLKEVNENFEYYSCEVVREIVEDTITSLCSNRNYSENYLKVQNIDIPENQKIEFLKAYYAILISNLEALSGKHSAAEFSEFVSNLSNYLHFIVPITIEMEINYDLTTLFNRLAQHETNENRYSNNIAEIYKYNWAVLPDLFKDLEELHSKIINKDDLSLDEKNVKTEVNDVIAPSQSQFTPSSSSMFKQQQIPAVSRLLKTLEDGNYDLFESSNNSDLMFQICETQQISPVEYAFKCLDIKALSIMLNCIENNIEQLKSFYSQSKTDNINLTSLSQCAQYWTSLSNYIESRFSRKVSLSTEDMDVIKEALSAYVATYARELATLPRWLLREHKDNYDNIDLNTADHSIKSLVDSLDNQTTGLLKLLQLINDDIQEDFKFFSARLDTRNKEIVEFKATIEQLISTPKETVALK